jgi:hypothetical protein
VSEPLVLLVLLGTGADATTDSMMAAARRALGSDAVVLVDASDPPTDRDALARGERVGARAIAKVSWAQGTLEVARLHVHVSPTDEWTDDEISFASQDAPNERGRTVGYALASMVQRLDRSRVQDEPPPPPPPPAPPIALTPAHDAGDAALRRPAAVGDVDVFANAIGAAFGPASAIGGSGGIRWWPSRHFGVRAAFGARTGKLEEVDGTATAFFGAAGPGYRVSVGRMLELAVRADLVFFRYSVTRVNNGFDTMRGRWLGAADLLLEAGLALGSRTAIVAGVGGELAFGSTAVNVGGVTVADIPVGRGIAELGGRFRF